MKKLFTLLLLVFVTAFANAQTKCTDVMYVSLYKWDFQTKGFVHDITSRSNLKFCMSENHVEIDNEYNTYIFLTTNVAKYDRSGETEMVFNGKDSAGKPYIVTYYFRDSGPSYNRMEVMIDDMSRKVRVRYYLNPY